MKKEAKPSIFAIKLGMIMFPFFYILDYFIYPDFREILLMIRIGVSICLAFILFIINRVDQKYYFPMVFTTVFLVSISISIMCFLTKDGFASSYYSGLLQIIVVTTLLFNLRPRQYVTLMIVIVSQHFILLSQLPGKIDGLLINIFAVGGTSILAVFVHQFIYNLVKENKSLKGLLPICSHCKKIRDDKGYWNQIEVYIQDHSDATFSHGVCAQCSDDLYGKDDWYIEMNQKNNTKE